MSLIKRILPSAAKDAAKRVCNGILKPIGWKLARENSTVIEDDWYLSPVDGVASRHRPLSVDDQDFQQAVEHLAAGEAFQRLDAVRRGEEVLYRLYLAGQLARAADHLSGEYVEFGTYRGATAFCMLHATRHSVDPKSIYLYDTFSGIPSHGMTEHEKRVGLGGMHRDTSVERVGETLTRFRDRVLFRPGLIPRTLDDAGPDQIAMMHVDLNLASPTLDALRWAYPRWSPGGICLLDDYLWQGFEDQRRLVDEFFEQQQLTIIALPTGQGIVLNRP